MEAQLEYMHIAYTFLHVWRRFACSVGDYRNKISASELSRKIIKSGLLVGYYYVALTCAMQLWMLKSGALNIPLLSALHGHLGPGGGGLKK